jgi:hypothetical protein
MARTTVKMTCSQWGCHPHEMYPPHEATGVAKLTLDHLNPPEVATFSMCQRCANELYLNTGWPRYYKKDPRFRWVQEPLENHE